MGCWAAGTPNCPVPRIPAFPSFSARQRERRHQIRHVAVLHTERVARNFDDRRTAEYVQEDLDAPPRRQHPQHDGFDSAKCALAHHNFCPRKKPVFHRQRFFRFKALSQLFDHLDPESSLQLVVDHDPRPLRYQLEARHGSRCNWSYLEQGPEIWRVRLRHLRD